MKLWQLTRPEGNYANYNGFDSLVVAAETEEDARKTHPYGTWAVQYRGGVVEHDWLDKPEDVVVKLLGTAEPDIKAGIICSDNIGS